jgi:hypothetical protein
VKPKGPYRLQVTRLYEKGVTTTNIQYQRITSARAGARRILWEDGVASVDLVDAEQRVIYTYTKRSRGGYVTPKHDEIRVTGR